MLQVHTVMNLVVSTPAIENEKYFSLYISYSVNKLPFIWCVKIKTDLFKIKQMTNSI